jgi:hypothetical protein
LISISFCTFSSVTFTISLVKDESVQKEIDINTEVLGIVNSEIVKVTDESVQKEIDIYFYCFTINYPSHFCVDIYFFLYILICYFYYFTINSSEHFCEIVNVIDESVQKEIDINTEVLGIVNGEIVKVTDKNVQLTLLY